MRYTTILCLLVILANSGPVWAGPGAGSLWTWGQNINGQLGDGESWTMRTSPRQIAGFNQIKAVAGGGAVTGTGFTLVLRHDGTVWSFGCNDYGQLGDGTTTDRTLPVQVIDNDNAPLSNVTAIAAGWSSAVALKSDGTVWGWGGEVGRKPAGADSRKANPLVAPDGVSRVGGFVAIAASHWGTVFGIKRDGTLWGWGSNYFGELATGGTDNSSHDDPVLITTDGTTPLAGVVAVSAGYGYINDRAYEAHVLALRSDGSVWSWGGNNSGQLGYATPINTRRPAQVSGSSGFVAIAAGGGFSVGLKNDGFVSVWGRNDLRQLCDGTTTNRFAPVSPLILGSPNENLASVAAIAAGESHFAVVRRDGTVWTCGDATYGQLGYYVSPFVVTDRPLVTQVPGLSGFEFVACGDRHTIAVASTWNVSLLENVAAAGTHASIAVDAGGKAYVGYHSTSTGDLRLATNSSGAWAWESIAGNTASDQHTSLAVDTNGEVHVSYFGHDPTAGGNRLRYSTDKGGAWRAVTVGGTDGSISGTSLALDASGSVHIAYTMSGGTIKYVTNSPSGVWSNPVTVDGYPASSPSLSIDAAGKIHVAYVTHQGGNYWITYRNKSGSTWSPHTDLYPSVNEYRHLSAVADGSGRMHVSYCDPDAAAGGLKYTTNASGAFYAAAMTLDRFPGNGQHTSLRLDRNGRPHIAYYDDQDIWWNGFLSGTARALKIAQRESSGAWRRKYIDQASDVGRYSSVALDAQDNVHVAYYDATSADLKYAVNADLVVPTGAIAITSGNTIRGTRYTNSTSLELSLSCTDDSGVPCAEMVLSNDGVFDDEPAEPYATTRTWSIAAGNGARTVYARFRDNTGNWSAVCSDTVVYDSVPPQGGTVRINNDPVPDQTRDTLVLLHLSSTDASGVVELQVRNEGEGWFTHPSAESLGWLLSPGSGRKTVSVRFGDSAGNWSESASDTILLDDEAPLTTITPAGGTYTAIQSVSLTCDDGSGVGCAAIRYCKGTGCSPAKAYTQPIPIESDTVLSFFSVDEIGNAESVREETYTFVQAGAELTLSLSHPAILQGEPLAWAAGQLSRVPDNGTDLSGLAVALTITDPYGRSTTLTALTNQFGQYRFDAIDPDPADAGHGFNLKGVYSFEAQFAGNGVLVPAESVQRRLLVGQSAGYAVIVQGRISGSEGLASHNKSANRIYRALLERGFVDENIQYFNYDTSQQGIEVDAVPSKAGIREAIEQWALPRMLGAPAPLYLVLVDHGTIGAFHIDDGDARLEQEDRITPAELDAWLGTLEQGLATYNPRALAERRVVIIGACYSGSFVAPLARAGRVVITSATAEEESYKGTVDPSDGVRSGEFFLDELFIELGRGRTLRESFVEAAERTARYTARGGANGGGDGAQSAVQHPLLEDDAVLPLGSTALSEEDGDGLAAAEITLGVGLTNAAASPAELARVAPLQRLPADAAGVTLWAGAHNDAEVDHAWIEVRNLAEALTGRGGSGQLTPRTSLHLLEWDGARYAASFDGSSRRRFGEVFPNPGAYEIFYFSQQRRTLEVTSMKRSLVYRGKPGNTPPGAPAPIAPADDPAGRSPTDSVLMLDWADSVDPDGDPVTYRVTISKNPEAALPGYACNPGADICREGLSASHLELDLAVGLQSATRYFWEVTALDAYGAASPSAGAWSFTTSNTNPEPPGFVRGCVSNALKANVQVPSPRISASRGSVLVSGSCYSLLASPGQVSISVEAGGYWSASVSATVVAGRITGRNVALTPIPHFWPPSLAPVGERRVHETATLSFQLVATDPDGDPVRFAAGALPAGATLNRTTGVFRWTPAHNQAGTYRVTLRASDGRFTDSETITIRVLDQVIFYDDFANSTAAGDPDWTLVLGSWGVGGSAKSFISDAGEAESLVLARRVPATYKAGVVSAKVRLDGSAPGGANLALLFAYRGGNQYRYVELLPGKVAIGQVGALGGQGTLRRLYRAPLVRGGQWQLLTASLAADGTVIVRVGTKPVASHRFKSAVTGALGLRAKAARSLVDDFTVRNASALR